MKKSKWHLDIRKDLIDQLRKHYGEVGKALIDQVDIYMSLCESARQLRQDIEKCGTKVEVINSRGIKNIKTNDSLIDLQKASAQMIKIRQQLHLDEPAAETDDLEDEM
jgi:hypothetical protein